MANPFDQFDASANPFDRFDTPQSQGVSAPRVVGQFAQGANKSFVGGVMSPLDIYGSLLKRLGVGPNAPSFSSVYGQAVDDLASLPLRIKDAVSQGAFDPIFAPRDAYNSRVEIDAPRNAAERIAADTGSAVGTTLSSAIPGTAITNSAKAGSVPSIIGGALKANPVAQTAFSTAGNVATSETGNPYIGAGVQLGLPILAHGAQRTFSAALPETTQEAERRGLLEFGRQNKLGPLTAGKILNSKGLQTLESAASNSPIPYIGGRVAATESAGRNAFQKAAIEKAGTTGATAATPGVLNATGKRIGQGFNAFKGETINVDPQFGSDLAAAKADFSKQLESQIPQSIMSKIDDLAKAPAAVSPGNAPGQTLPVPNTAPNQSVSIDGETFQNIRSKLSKMLGRASGTDAQALRKMIDAMDDLAERQLPRDVVDDYKTARQQWRNYLALKASVNANNADTAVGNMSTAAFARAAEGNPDLERLAQYGNAFVGDKMGNTSRTAGHNVANHMMGLGGLYGAFAGLRELGLNPLYAGSLVGSIALPPLAETALNNPGTRALLLSRYRNPTPAFVKPSLMGTNILNTLKERGQ